MVGLHVVYDQVIQLPPRQHMLQILKILHCDGLIHRVHHQRLFIVDKVAVVGNAPGNGIYALKQRKPPVLAADPADAIRYFFNAIHVFALISCVVMI